MPIIELSFESGESSLSVRTFRVEEAISQLFAVKIVARSPHQIDLEPIVGRAAALHVESGVAHAHHRARRWSGVCRHIEQTRAEPTGLSTYELVIQPSLWLLTQRRNYRVHQHLSIPDIVDRVLSEWRIEPAWRVDRGRYPKLEYKVQYGESDYAFFSRLLEEAGIAFTFEDDDEVGSRLTLTDALHTGAARSPALRWVDQPEDAAEAEYVTELRLSHEVRPGALAILDHDFRRPAYALTGEADRASGLEGRYEQAHYRPGAFLIEGGKGGDTPVADDKGVARHDDAFGKERADRALAGERVRRRTVSFRPTCSTSPRAPSSPSRTTRTRAWGATGACSPLSRPSRAASASTGPCAAWPCSPTRPIARRS